MSGINGDYANRLARGDRVQLARDIFRDGQLLRGQRGTVIAADSNAGFRGIEASVEFDNGQRGYNIGTALLRRLEGEEAS